MASKREIPLDEDERDAVVAALSSGGFIQTRAEIFNSKYVEGIKEDAERTEACTYKTVDETGNVIIVTEKLENMFNTIPDSNMKKLK